MPGRPSCGICSRSFSKRSNLRRHEKTIHNKDDDRGEQDDYCQNYTSEDEDVYAIKKDFCAKANYGNHDNLSEDEDEDAYASKKEWIKIEMFKLINKMTTQMMFESYWPMMKMVYRR